MLMASTHSTSTDAVDVGLAEEGHDQGDADRRAASPSTNSGTVRLRLGPAPSRSRLAIGTSSASLRPKSKVSMRRKCSTSSVSV